MRRLSLLLLLPSACAPSDSAGVAERHVATLVLSELSTGAEADCSFSQDAFGPSLLVVRLDGPRIRGTAHPAADQPVQLSGTRPADGEGLAGGVQMEGRGLTVAVHPASLPGVPVGTGGVR
ncbi:hypothetical protein, partial [Blastomonas sp.]|uniref:hypothetical protein n=1 Tax=Blastomonas sp. TaxID=1909299 RepID=UPI0035942B01